MPTSQSSNAQTGGKPEPKDQDNVAALLSEDRLDASPGGGGAMGAGAADPLAGTAAGKTGAATPNSPIDAHLPGIDETTGDREAQARSLEDDMPTDRSAA